MKYLADSNIISEPTKPTPNNKVLTLLNKNHRKISISVITYFELFYGILLLQDGKGKQALKSYLEKGTSKNS